MKKLTLFFVALFFISLSFADDCNSYLAVISPDGNYIFFSSDRIDGTFQIFRTDIDGSSNLVQLTNLSGMTCIYPAVSPDGNQIAFQAGSTGYGSDNEIYIMNSDGSNLVKLTDNMVYDGYPNFSPDGTKIVFSAWDESPYPEIFIMNIDGTGRTQLTNNEGAYWQSAPIFNPSGTKIYFQAGYNADDYIVMMNPDGTNWVNITEPNSFGDTDYGLHFSADGSKIIFSTTEWVGYQNGSDIVIADADGSNKNKITNSSDGKYYYGPVLNNNGDAIFYSFYWPGHNLWNLHKMNVDGSNDMQLSDCTITGINEQSTKTRIITPNPAEDFIIINLNTGFFIDIFDLTGKLVLHSNAKQIDLSGIKSGLYLAIIRNTNHQIIKTEKLMVKQ